MAVGDARRPVAHRVVDTITILGVVASALTYTGAVLSYPGGSYAAPHAVGHDPLRNYVCDLARETAHNGVPNPYPALARAALVCLAVAFAAFAYRWVRPRSWRALGIVSAVGAGLVALPVDAQGRGVHDIGILLAGIPALGGSFLVLRAQRSAGLSLEHALGVAALVVMAITATAFVVLLVAGVGERFLPVLQKLSATLAMAWLVRSSLVRSSVDNVGR